MGNKILSEFERKVLELITLGEESDLTIIRKQINYITSLQREFTSQGFYINLEVIKSVEKTENKDFELGGVTGIIDLNDGGRLEYSFILFVRNGVIDMLECFADPVSFWEVMVLQKKE